MTVIRHLATALALASAMILSAPRSDGADVTVTTEDPAIAAEFVEGDTILVRVTVTGADVGDVCDVNAVLIFTRPLPNNPSVWGTWGMDPPGEVGLTLQPTGKYIAEFTAVRASNDEGFPGFYIVRTAANDCDGVRLDDDSQPIKIKEKPPED